MQTLKKGSKGEDVKILQRYLSTNADGIFGAGTEAKVKEFQKKNGLTADGIVGPKTWELLEKQSKNLSGSVSSSSKCIDPTVIYNPLSVHISPQANRTIKYIAIHYTAGASSAPGKANANKVIFNSRAASADFAVDDLTIVQFNPDLSNYYCWAVGDKKNIYSSGGWLNGKASNRNTVSIEICSNLRKGTSAAAANHDGWTFTELSLELAAKLVKILMKKYNIDIDHVIRHYDVTGKLCPGIIGWNNELIYDNKTGKATKERSNSDKWEQFKKKLI